MARKFSIALNLVSLLALVALSGVTYFHPAGLSEIRLDVATAQVVIMQIISFILLLGFVQRTLEPGWRAFSLVGSFLVMGQSILMSRIFF